MTRAEIETLIGRLASIVADFSSSLSSSERNTIRQAIAALRARLAEMKEDDRD